MIEITLDDIIYSYKSLDNELFTNTVLNNTGMYLPKFNILFIDKEKLDLKVNYHFNSIYVININDNWFLFKVLKIDIVSDSYFVIRKYYYGNMQKLKNDDTINDYEVLKNFYIMSNRENILEKILD